MNRKLIAILTIAVLALAAFCAVSPAMATTRSQIAHQFDSAVDRLVNRSMIDKDRASPIHQGSAPAFERKAGTKDLQKAGRGGKSQVNNSSDQGAENMAKRVVATVAKLTPFEFQDIVLELREGAVLLNILNANDVPAQDVVNAMMDRINRHLQEALDRGDLTEERVGDRLEQVETAILEILDSPDNAQVIGKSGQGKSKVFGPGGLLAAASELLQVEPGELRDSVQRGVSIAQFAESSGVSQDVLLDTLIDAPITRVLSMLDEGHIDEAKTEQILDRLDDAITLFATRSSA